MFLTLTKPCSKSQQLRTFPTHTKQSLPKPCQELPIHFYIINNSINHHCGQIWRNWRCFSTTRNRLPRRLRHPARRGNAANNCNDTGLYRFYGFFSVSARIVFVPFPGCGDNFVNCTEFRFPAKHIFGFSAFSNERRRVAGSSF